MRAMLGAFIGFIICLGALFGVQNLGILEKITLPKNLETVQSEIMSKVEPVASPIEVKSETEKPVIEAVKTQDQNVTIRQGSDMEIDTNSADNGHFVSTTTGENVADDIADHGQLPDNIHLFISETGKYRLNSAAIEKLPQSVNYVLWPDNELTSSVKNYFLQSPPVDIMEAYAMKNVVDDEAGLYASKFEASKGVFARNLEVLSTAEPLTKLIYGKLAEKQKALILFSGRVDPGLNKIIDETQVNFQRVDYVIDPHHESITIKQQWDAIMQKAAHGEELYILLEADDLALKDFITALN